MSSSFIAINTRSTLLRSLWQRLLSSESEPLRPSSWSERADSEVVDSLEEPFGLKSISFRDSRWRAFLRQCLTSYLLSGLSSLLPSERLPSKSDGTLYLFCFDFSLRALLPLFLWQRLFPRRPSSVLDLSSMVYLRIAPSRWSKGR